ncbi:MAG: magnesium transporter [Anaerosolibacter sp.]|jgi:magnesium transporter|uniref:magnesium transporter n=1 Tax=Anaerosolibacter sp. TaxID=1872527 RepID=UPI0026181506|nr:magnesium transporter [Anaerosolibacter sp.]MDF2548578.1 magnesium transporter [Anaerosolibacter sp.]
MPYEFYEKDLIQFLINTSQAQIDELIEDIHPADILDAIHAYEGDKLLLFQKLPEWVIAAIIDYAEDEEKYELLSIFPEKRQKDIVEEMSSDELVDLLGSIPKEQADDIIVKLDLEEAEEVRELLTYKPDTAGGIMATEFICVQDTMSVGSTLKYLQQEAPDAETAYYIYVLGEDDHLKGVVSLRDIVVSNFDVKIGDIMNENVISIPVDMDQEEVGHIFEKYSFLTMPVVNDKDEMLGIVTVDDIMAVLSDEHTEDMYRLAGLQEGEKVTGTIGESVKSRLPWLFVNLVTAMLAAATVSLFEDTISKVVALATFMPIVAGMGGNAGTQTLTLIVRGIALGELTFENAKKVLVKEFGVGISNGFAIGLAVATLGYFWERKPIFGLVIGLAMFLNLIAATTAGFLVPVTLKRFKIDPALASAVFVTTVTDVLGFFFFLGLATLFITHLI